MKTTCFRPVAFLIAAAAAGCSSKGDSSFVVASGHVEATDVRISTKIGGRLVRFPIREGDRVTAGQELGAIETTDLSLALQQARAEKAGAEAELRLRLAGA